MLWIAIAGAVVLLLVVALVRVRRQVPRSDRALSTYHDGLTALGRIERNRSA